MKFLAQVGSYNIFFLHLSYGFQKCVQKFCNCLDLGGPVVLRHKNPPNSAEWAVCVSLDLWGPCIYRNLDYIFGIYMINEEKNVIWTNLCKKLHENCLISEVWQPNYVYFSFFLFCSKGFLYLYSPNYLFESLIKDRKKCIRFKLITS